MRQALLNFAIAIAMAPFMANAAPVQDIEPNDSTIEAQDIDGFFDLSFNALITGAVLDNTTGLFEFPNTSEIYPHAEIIGLGNNDTYDWYSFEIVTEGSVGIFDIDCAWQNDENECSGSGLSDQFDAFVELFDTDGNRLEDQFLGRDDGSNVFGFGEPQDPGSNGGAFEPERASRDPFFIYRFDQPGRYFVRVGSFAGYNDPSEAPGTSFSGPAEGDYLLHVSIVVEDDDGDGVVNDFDLCPNTPPGQVVDPAGCAADETLDKVRADIKLLMSKANKKARDKLRKALKKLDEARDKLARGDVKDGLKKLKDTVKALDKARKEGVHVRDLVRQLVEYARAKAQAAIALGGNSKDIKKAREEMAKAEKELAKGKPDKAIEHFAKAWEKATKS